MSTTIDQKVVEMRFDNRHFEQNVSKTMSTLDKFKQKLHLDGATKGLENVNSAAKKVDMTGLGTAVESVGVKFSALQVMGVTALTNITNSAVNAAKRFVESLTIAPISDGFSEYEMTLNAVQTTMAATGKTANQVEKELKKLDEYADKTVYSTADMLNNLPKFTNAGVDLEKSITAMIGIANATALAGGGASQASSAFYNLGQAIGTGYLTRMDYNSINNAGIATMEWKNQMVEAAIAQGTLTKVGEDAYQAGNKTLTLQQLFIDGLQEQWATTDVMMKVFGDYGNETTEIGKKAYSAAQDIKTFTQMTESLKATAGTGWKDTWQIMFGDLDQAKVLWTGLTNFISEFITKTADFRNTLLEGALGSPFAKLAEKISSVTGATEEMKEVTKDYVEVVDKVLGGEFGNGQARWDKLTEAGYDWAKVQNMINERLGSSVRHVEQLNEAQEEANKTQATTVEQLVEMSDAQLESIGFTKAEIKAFHDLKEQSEKTGISVNELIKDMDQLSGRNLLINSFKNAGQGLIGVFTALKVAWQDIFPPKSMEERSAKLYDMIAALHKFSTSLIMSEETSDKLQRTLKGVFAIIDIVSTLVGGGLKIAFKAVTELLKYFDLDILDVTASVGDAIVGFRDWLDSVLDISGAIEFVAPIIERAVNAVRGWIKAIGESKAFKDFVNYVTGVRDGFRALFGGISGMESFANLMTKLSEAGKSIREWFSSLKDSENIPADIIKGFANGIKEGAPEIVDAMIALGKEILRGICEVLGIHSPSTEMAEVGENTTAGFVQGIQNGASAVWNTIKGLFTSIIDWIKNIDFGKIFAVAIGGGILFTVNKVIGIVEDITSPLAGLGDVFENVADVVETFGKSLKKNMAAKRFKTTAQSILMFAVAIGILAASVYLLAQVEDGKKIWNAVGAITAIAVVMGVLALVASKLNSIDVSVQFGKISLFLIGLTAAVLLLSLAIKSIASIEDPAKYEQGIGGVIAIIAALGAVMVAYGMLAKTGNTKSIDKVGGVLLKMSVAMLLLVGVAKIISEMSKRELRYAGIALGAVAGGLLAFVLGLQLIALIPSNVNFNKIGSMLLKISVAMLLLVGIVKIIAGMSKSELEQGGIGLGVLAGGLLVFVAALQLIGMIPGRNMEAIGPMLLKVSGAIAILAIVARLIAGMTWGDMGKAAAGLAGLVGIIALLVLTTKIGGKEMPKVAGTLILMSVAIAILAGMAVVLSLIDLGGLAKGIVAVGFLSLFMMGLVKATKGASDVKGTFIGMAIAIGVIAAAVIALSFIDGKKLAGATIAMSMLMLVFSSVVKAAGTMQKAMGSLIVMTVAIGVLTGALYLLAKLPVESTFGAAVALSTLLLALSGAMFIASKAGPAAMKSVGAMALMGLVLGELVLILGLMDHFDVIPSMEVAKSLSLLLISMSAALVLLGGVGTLGPAAFIGIGALAVLIAGIGGLIVGIGALVDKFPQLETFIDKGIPILQKIGEGLGSFFGGIVGGFLNSATYSLPEVASNLSTFMDNLSGFVDGVKTIDDATVTGAGNLVKMMALISGARILEWGASLISGESSMDVFATNMVQFADAIVTFSDKVKGKIDEESVLAASSAGKMLAEMQATMTGTGGIVQWFSGEKNLNNFGAQIVLFGEAIVKFSDTVKGKIDEEAVNAAANAGTVMATLQSKVAGTGGVVQWFCGEKNLSEFGTQLVAFGNAIVEFSNAVSQEGSINENAITATANAGTIMSKMQESLVGTGGVVQWFCGEKDMSLFGTQLVAFGNAIVEFSKTVSQDGGINEDAIKAAANAGTLMAKLQSSLESINGIAQGFSGVKDIGLFGTQIVKFGEAIVSFSNTVSGNIDAEAVTAAANAGKVVALLQKSIPENKWFDGKMSIANFGNKLVKFGESITDFSAEVADIDTLGVDNAITVANRLIMLVKNMKNLEAEGISQFKKVKTIGEAVQSYSESVSGADFGKVEKSISSITGLKNFISSLAGIDASGVKSFKNAAKSLSDISIESFVEAFSNAQSELTSVGQKIITPIISGIKSKQTYFAAAGNSLIMEFEKGCKARTSAASKLFSDMLRSAINGMRSYYSSFYNAGAYVASGFATGIRANIASAASAAASMAASAVAAARAHLRINSPSKEFYEIGDYSGQGFVNALYDYADASYKAGSEMADSAKQGLSNAIRRVVDIINSDMDTQPTIRPVLDLSDVESGVSSISGMFGMRPSVGVLGHVGAISASMRGYGQNGDNSEVVSAINKLNKNLGKVGNTYNTISGITYDDGSNISDAVKTLVRAARIERRT